MSKDFLQQLPVHWKFLCCIRRGLELIQKSPILFDPIRAFFTSQFSVLISFATAAARSPDPGPTFSSTVLNRLPNVLKGVLSPSFRGQGM